MRLDKEMRESILRRLKGYRLRHTLGCEKAAVQLARQYGEDVEKCAAGALLHDITKGLSPEEQLYLCEKYSIIPIDIEIEEPKILHGKTAAQIARLEYGVPADVAAAIACHTTGRGEMTKLDKILYLADFVEETRRFDGVDKARALCKTSLDSAMLYCLDFSIRELLERKKKIHMDTIFARNGLIGTVGEDKR